MAHYRSSNLIKIVQERGFEGMVADGLDLPYRDNAFVSVFMQWDGVSRANGYPGFRRFYCCHSSFRIT